MPTRYFVIVMLLASSLFARAQSSTITGEGLLQFVAPAPENIFEKFRDAGMSPTTHPLTASEKTKIEEVFRLLPPVHRKILAGHLHSISFMDNMPNTALTSPVESKDSTAMFNITFRAGILNETISEWATKKENTLFDRSATPEFEISVEAGKLDAFLYVLLHEATHVADAVLEITPHVEDAGDLVTHTPYTKDIWHKMNVPAGAFIDSLVEKTIFRGGGRVPISSAPALYTHLAKLPFVSLYGTASWYEDLAELETIYHLMHKIKQRFYVTVKKNGHEVIRFEPMANRLVKKRLRHLKVFYSTRVSTHALHKNKKTEKS